MAAALVDRHLADAAAYRAARSRVAEEARAAARALGHASIEMEVNGADDDARGRFYATVTGLSAEAGDDGQPGRGNRVNGLITPRRAMTLESVAGKNPVTHVGKLYNIAACLLAEELVAELPGIAEAECRLVSRIGRRVDDPPLLHVACGAATPASRRCAPGSRRSRGGASLVRRSSSLCAPRCWRARQGSRRTRYPARLRVSADIRSASRAHQMGGSPRRRFVLDDRGFDGCRSGDRLYCMACMSRRGVSGQAGRLEAPVRPGRVPVTFLFSSGG